MSDDPLMPPVIRTDEEWRQFQVLHTFQQTRHLGRIRTYTGWLLALVVIGIMISSCMGMAAAEAASSGY